MKNIIVILVVVCAYMNVQAQSYVLNPYFEDLLKKPKSKGMIEMADTWFSPTNDPADLYAKIAKSDLIKVPKNEFGEEKPKSGSNYAGILVYSAKNKEPRTYLSTQLIKPLEKGQLYCIRFHVSLTELSKYASNNIGLYVSEENPKQDDVDLTSFEPQIIHSRNRIFEKQWDWEPICRIYVAKGGEEYITIGNFEKQEKVTFKKIKRPPGYTSAQKSHAYYYIDEVTVTPGATRTNCKCEKGNYAFAHLEKEKKSFGSDQSEINKQKPKFIGSTEDELAAANSTTKASVKSDVIIPFGLAKSDVSSSASKLDETINYLKENKDVKIDVIGHCDKTEARVVGLSEKRMKAVTKYLVSKGITKERISESDVKDSAPLDDSGLKENRSKNTVVEIKFKK